MSHEHLDDAALIERVLGGDREAFEVVVSRYQDRAFYQALGMVSDRDIAADLVQDAFIRAYSALDRCADPARFNSWFFRIVRNRCLDHLKERRRDNVPLDSIAPPATPRTGPAADIRRSEIGEAITHALSRLPAQQREAFLLKHVDGRSYTEMSEILEASVSALKMRVKRARESMQASLEEVGLEAG